MCGLCGVLGSELGDEHWLFFQQLMIMSTLRGPDGAGIVAVPFKAGEAPDILRSQGTAADLVTGHEYWGMKKKKLTCYMGHARQPTKGSYDISDVHPHVCGPIVGMHNGTMLRINGKILKDKDSDSRALFQSIQHQGIDNTIAQSRGAYALSYINKATDQLCFLRNKARPLSFAKLEGASWMAWASEAGFLRMAAARQFPGRKIEVFQLNEDTYTTFRLHGNQSGVNYVDFRKIEPDAVVVPFTEPSGTHTDDGKATQMWETSKGNFVTMAELDVILGSGCSWCTGPVSTADYMMDHLCFFEPEQFICRECLQLDDNAREYAQSYLKPGQSLPEKTVGKLH